MKHYHVIRYDYDTRTGHPLDPVGLGIVGQYHEALALEKQDGRQFRLPSSQRWVLHRWLHRPCWADHE